ncbi:A/G-specific adenine glycosylase [Aliidiomarina shirensis]|uniref:Adenine DNA glycosylase n=1 Tax=Aliidiomarina shirensis TaxID=1048642 RepID=A0A432WKQ5_9GAMM|nr:A/G-specific adenine glycosylase [Aliidiomarina shirensis]RUO34392.1 A/G-specific adenine glycosylase [Aliidiomarina shirensis]
MQPSNKTQNQLNVGDFANTVLAWQHSHGRHDLPWQKPATPYRVLVSEIMLQQTQVATVIPYFQRWMQVFPNIETLANASEDEVMAQWQGLGYYSRARNLQKAARYIVEELSGEFPRELTDIEKIPGVGRYTAGAIRSFAYDAYGPIVDGNVRRLFCRLFGIEGQVTSSAVNKTLWRHAEQLTPKTNNRNFAQGLLDLGATLCKKRNPNCQACPFSTECVAYRENKIEILPTPKIKKTTPVKEGHFIWLEDNALVLEKRPDKGIWASLWSLPEVTEAPKGATLKGRFKHVFSHYKLEANVWQLNAPQDNSANNAVALHEKLGTYERQSSHTTSIKSREEFQALGLPAPIRVFIEEHWPHSNASE